jgi:hypothetical protein
VVVVVDTVGLPSRVDDGRERVVAVVVEVDGKREVEVVEVECGRELEGKPDSDPPNGSRRSPVRSPHAGTSAVRPAPIKRTNH